jgi:hypothetical protein
MPYFHVEVNYGNSALVTAQKNNCLFFLFDHQPLSKTVNMAEKK